MIRITHLLLIGLVLVIQACSRGSAADSATAIDENVTAVHVTVPVRERLNVPVRAVGTVGTEQEAKPAFKTGGVIARILVAEGDVVRAGQLLATLNPTEIDAQVQQANEGVDKARRDLDRAKNLYADSVATLEQVQNATTALSVAEQNLEMARFNRNYSEIRAPFAGKVVRKLMNEGEIVGPGTPVFYLLSNNRSDFVIRAGLSDRDWARLQVGDRAEITMDAYPGQVFPAKVSQLADIGNMQTGTFDAEFRIQGAAPRLAIGLVATVEAFPQEGEQLTIPVDALLESRDGKATVYVVKPDQTVESRGVHVGTLHGGRVVILAGLQPTDTVVTTGAAYLESGSKVHVVEAVH